MYRHRQWSRCGTLNCYLQGGALPSLFHTRSHQDDSCRCVLTQTSLANIALINSRLNSLAMSHPICSAPLLTTSPRSLWRGLLAPAPSTHLKSSLWGRSSEAGSSKSETGSNIDSNSETGSSNSETCHLEQQPSSVSWHCSHDLVLALVLLQLCSLLMTDPPFYSWEALEAVCRCPLHHRDLDAVITRSNYTVFHTHNSCNHNPKPRSTHVLDDPAGFSPHIASSYTHLGIALTNCMHGPLLRAHGYKHLLDPLSLFCLQKNFLCE